jgi:head-tail adaptor
MKWAGRLRDTITVQSRTGAANGYGDPTWGSQSTLAAKVMSSQKRIINAQGTLVQASHELLTETALTLGDRVWIPGDDTTKTTAARVVLQSVGESTVDGGYALYKSVLG